jgi:hypothetical protein
MEKIQITKGHITGISILVLVLFFLFTIGAWVEECDKSKIYVNQRAITGKYEVWTDGGL